MPDYYVGIDPGPSTGIAILSISDFDYGWEVFQVYGTSAMWLIDKIYTDYCPRAIEAEEFVPSNKAGTKGKDAQETRAIADYAVAAAGKADIHAVARQSGNVFPWSTEKRLKATGFPWGIKFKDARSAGKHALYLAVRDGKERDPLA